MECQKCKSQLTCERDIFKTCHYVEDKLPDNPCNTCQQGNCSTCDYRNEDKTMTVTEALQLIEKNEGVPALNYAINYVHHALQLDQTAKSFKIQLLYVLNNISRWRQNKASTTTAAEIKECRAVLKKASV